MFDEIDGNFDVVAIRTFKVGLLAEHDLREGSISSFKKLTRAFEARFVSCSRVLRPLDSLLSMTMREGETLKTYSDRY